MDLRRFAAIAVAAPLAFLAADAGAQSHTGHAGAGHGGGHFAGNAHFHGGAGGFRHGGHFGHGFHAGRFGGWAIVGGGLWYPWYGYPAPAYANAWYCPSVGAYYPTVLSCPGDWVLVQVPQ
jgi:hypothetical protein